MEHLFLLLDMLSLLIGFGAFITFVYFTFQSKDRTMYYILVFFTAFNLDMIFTTVYDYLKYNVADVFWAFSNLLLFVQIGISAFLIFSIPFFTAALVKSEYSKVSNSVFLVVAGAQFSGIIFTEYAKYIFRLGIITALLFSIIILMIRYKKITEQANQKVVIRMGFIALVSFITNLMQLLDLIVLFRILVPLVYTLTCIVFILHIIENYFKSGPIFDETQQNYDLYGLTKREKEVVKLVLKGYSNKKTAEHLHISLSTVKSHIHNIFKKTGVTNRYEFIHLIKFRGNLYG